MHNFRLSEAFGWTPKEINELDEETKLKYLKVLEGMGKADKKNG